MGRKMMVRRFKIPTAADRRTAANLKENLRWLLGTHNKNPYGFIMGNNRRKFGRTEKPAKQPPQMEGAWLT